MKIKNLYFIFKNLYLVLQIEDYLSIRLIRVLVGLIYTRLDICAGTQIRLPTHT